LLLRGIGLLSGIGLGKNRILRRRCLGIGSIFGIGGLGIGSIFGIGGLGIGSIGQVSQRSLATRHGCGSDRTASKGHYS
jgi:hypothetical protein